MRSQRYKGTLSPEDAMQEGVLGFLHAVGKFVPGRSSIQTYSDWWIRCYVQRAAASNGVVKVWTTSSLRAARTEIYREGAEQGMSPIDVLADPEAVSRIADACSVSEKTVLRLRAGFAPKVGESFLGNGPGHLGVSPDESASHPPGAEDEMLAAERAALVHKALALLAEEDPRMARVLRRTFSDPPVTLQELGRQMGLSRERVRQIEIRARPRFARIFNGLNGEEPQAEAEEPTVAARRAAVHVAPDPEPDPEPEPEVVRRIGHNAPNLGTPLAAAQMYEVEGYVL